MSAKDYFRPLAQMGPARPAEALPLAGGWAWFCEIEVLQRGKPAQIISAADLPEDVRETLTAPRPNVGPMNMGQPQVMGILNATPDSFSDGGKHAAAQDAIAAGVAMVKAGATLLDIGGESTRPGAQPVPAEDEIRRVVPIIEGLRMAGVSVPISIDTRKEAVANRAVAVGATLVNDVSGFSYDPALLPFCATSDLPVCVMHALGDPTTMQDDPRYEDVLLDVYDFLQDRIKALRDAGVAANQIIADPGIGFGKTLDHNLALLSRLSLFHGLGVPILLGASRKGFIGRIGMAPKAQERTPGSIAVGLGAVLHGIQVLRVHDVAETIQAMALWQAAMTGKAL